MRCGRLIEVNKEPQGTNRITTCSLRSMQVSAGPAMTLRCKIHSFTNTYFNYLAFTAKKTYIWNECVIRVGQGGSNKQGMEEKLYIAVQTNDLFKQI